jgi:hypothetical protein
VKSAITAALATYANATHLQFAEAAAGVTPSIVVKVANLGTCGPGSLIANGEFPRGPNEPLTLNLNQKCTFWTDSVGTMPSGSIDLQSVLTHEFGHNLGLQHSTLGPGGAVMFPVLPANDIKRALIEDDWIAIGALYNSWSQVPGCASDIGGGADASVWMIGCDLQFGAGGALIFKWNKKTNTFENEQAGGRAMFIAVGPTGIPWVVNSFGDIFRRTSNSVSSGSWEHLPGCALDIGVGADGSAWVIGCLSATGGHSIHKWNGSDWDRTTDNGAAESIAVDSMGRPWVVNDAGDVFKRTTSTTDSGSWTILPRPPGGARDIGIMRAIIENLDYAWIVAADGGLGAANVFVWDNQDPETMMGMAPNPAKWVRDLSFLGQEAGVRVTVARHVARIASVAWVRDGSGRIFTKQR